MFGIIRRVSYGLIPRPDRPWEEDPTSNAPHRNRKRRLSSAERDVADDGEPAGKKKVRAESATPSVADAEATFLTPPPQNDTKEVKEVTQGVKEVDLEGETKSNTAVVPESIPLPEETAGELDEPPSDLVESPSPVEERSKVSSRDATPVSQTAQATTVETGVPTASTQGEANEENDAEVAPSEEPTEGQEEAEKLVK